MFRVTYIFSNRGTSPRPADNRRSSCPRYNDNITQHVIRYVHFTYRRSKALQLRVPRALLLFSSLAGERVMTIGLGRFKKRRQYRLHDTICGGFVKSRCSIVPIFRLFRLIFLGDLTCNADGMILSLSCVRAY